MTTPTTTPAPETNPLARSNGATADHGKLRVENKIASQLQNAIDDRGRYSYKLRELALGYAAGAGIKEDEAKEHIKGIFQERIGMGVQDYLEQHRAEHGLPIDRGNGYER